LLELLFEDRAVVLRLSNVYGGDGYLTKKKDNFVAHLATDNPITVFNPTQTKDFVHIGSVMEWCLKALTLPYGIYDVCSGFENTIENVALLAGTIRNVEVVYE